MELKLTGKTAFISGSTQGIGFAIAQQLLQEGVSVTINGRKKSKTEQAKKQLQKQFPNGIISAISADFSKKEEVENLLQHLTDIDILVNNIGIFEVEEFQNITDEDWYNYFEVNVMSSVRLSRKLLPKMQNKNWGRIIFISSESGVNVPENMIHYGMTKAAMSAIANGLSKLTKGTKITVNTILGGPTYSDGVSKVVEQVAEAQSLEVEQMKNVIIQQSNPQILLQRFIEPNEIASLVTYLASPLSIATNGASLRADSGVLKII
ncbi:NAD(P)-dependent dehydrogenase (short-subunit alcohol dehydrogenase family) [Mesonia hippocampi]|uniref:NAD(P)-dependent dehydrogenase (Short-subunit alcohol dehydrogenase family) n=1 Tax=Mesonia hippocampi TaxID=1628250 RepID=A0A840EIY0_9FLAO|nr:SDR family NAD(P)-dependent oxidoreductase [Mesonia hippocampi]MBB4118118.1 NAD(P)-dependent dehydrogenase (short-subunit alcohol dehydrogenase family) [Mesonia hippocampi]